jgi:hypothetical protein
MQFESKIYKSVDMDPDILSQQIDTYREGDTYGYFLVDDKLVPKSLVTRIHSHLCDITFDYGYVWSVEGLLGEEFWSSLDDVEKSVAGACLLIIIENGYAIPVPDEFEMKH